MSLPQASRPLEAGIGVARSLPQASLPLRLAAGSSPAAIPEGNRIRAKARLRPGSLRHCGNAL
eukprot:5610251-Lingulodinium_polyedra.AAC.1